MIPNTVYEYIGSLIKRRRKQLGLKQHHLATRLGISRGSLANIETGRQGVLVHQLYKFAAALDLKPHDFLPPSSDALLKGAWSDVIPTNLNAQQREQIARLLDGSRVETPTPKGDPNGKSAKN